MLPVPELQTKDSPLLSREAHECALSIFRGFHEGISDICSAIAHPIETMQTMIKPLYNAAIVAAKDVYYADPDLVVLHGIISKNPQLYQDAKSEIQSDLQNIERALTEFKNAPLSEKMRAIARISTQVILPGQVVRSVGMINNYVKYGTVTKPPLFRNCEELGETIRCSPRNWTADEIRKTKGHREFMYAYTDQKKLILSDECAPSLCGHYILDLYHSDVASLRPVYSAGWAKFLDGKLISIDNNSGHYMPHGKGIANVMERAFLENGFREAKGKAKVYPDNPTRGEKIKVPLAPPVNRKPHPHLHPPHPPHSQENIEEDFYYHDIYPCSSIYEERQNNFVASVRQLVELVKEEKKDAVRVAEIADNIRSYGLLTCSVAELALRMGGHQRTWTNIHKASSSVISFASNISTLATMGPTLSLTAAVTCGIGALVAGFSFLSSIFGDDDDAGGNGLGEALQAIMSSLQVIHESIVRGFSQLSSQLHSSTVVILADLSKIHAQLQRLEQVTHLSFSELHKKELIGIADLMHKDLVGEIKLDKKERLSLLRQLSGWIDHHSRSCLQTMTIRNGGDATKCVALLASKDFDVFSNLTLFLNILNNVVVDFEVRDLSSIPNLRMYENACKLYLTAASSYRLFDGFEPLYGRMVKTFENVSDLVRSIGKNQHALERLALQYEHYRFGVGRRICELRPSLASVPNPSMTLLKQALPISEKAELLYEDLNAMELRRILLDALSGTFGIKTTRSNRDRKEDLLNKPVKFYLDANTNPEKIKNHGDLKRELLNGADPNALYGWLKIIHGVVEHNLPDNEELWHLLFKCPGINLDYWSLTWGIGCKMPIKYAIDNKRIDLLILIAARGFDVSLEPQVHLQPDTWEVRDVHGNLGSFANSPDKTARAMYLLAKDMNNPKGTFAFEKLRKAYKYYSLCEAGLVDGVDNSIDSNCLLLLACVLGCPQLINSSQKLKSFDFGTTTDIQPDFTLATLARCCGRRDTYDYILEKGICKVNSFWRKIGFPRERGNRFCTLMEAFQTEPDKDSAMNMYLQEQITTFDLIKKGLQLTGGASEEEEEETFSLLVESLEVYVSSVKPSLQKKAEDYYLSLRKCKDLDKNKETLNKLDIVLRSNPNYPLGSKVDRFLNS